jgi:hypothetical protein
MRTLLAATWLVLTMPYAAPDIGDTAGPEKEFQENRDIRAMAKRDEKCANAKRPRHAPELSQSGFSTRI